MTDTAAIRRRAARAYGVRNPGPAFEQALADIRALLTELRRLDRRLFAAQLERAADAGGARASAILLARTYRKGWNRGATREAARRARAGERRAA